MNWQVLYEFYANALRLRVDLVEARRALRRFAQWEPLVPDLQLIERAWHWTDVAQVPWWDSLILASAERLDCRYLLSEDFQPGREYGAIRIVSPFLVTPPPLS